MPIHSRQTRIAFCKTTRCSPRIMPNTIKTVPSTKSPAAARFFACRLNRTLLYNGFWGTGSCKDPCTGSCTGSRPFFCKAYGAFFCKEVFKSELFSIPAIPSVLRRSKLCKDFCVRFRRLAAAGHTRNGFTDKVSFGIDKNR